MRRFAAFGLVVLLAAAVCGALVAGQAAGTGATERPDHVTLTWTGDTTTTMTVTWRTSTTVTRGVVEYEPGSSLAGEPRRTTAQASTFTTDLGAAELFTATLTGLQPGTAYSYRVGDGTQWSGTEHFTTAETAPKQLTFLVFGDSQSSVGGSTPYAEWRTTVHNAWRAHPEARFFVNVGDLVDVGQSGEHWNAWFAGAAGVIDRIPSMPVVGNHEEYEGFTLLRPKVTGRPVYWEAQFHLPQNGPEEVRNQAYSYDVGPVHCVVLDSQQGEEAKHGDIFPPQQRWLEADLAASKAPWKIAFLHRTPYSLRTRANENVKQAFDPILERNGVNVVFAAHDHGVAYTYPIRDGALQKPGDPGTIYYVVGRSGSKTYPDLAQKPYDEFFYDPKDQPNYLVVEVTGERLTVTAVKQEGRVVDRLVVDKRTGERTS